MVCFVHCSWEHGGETGETSASCHDQLRCFFFSLLFVDDVWWSSGVFLRGSHQSVSDWLQGCPYHLVATLILGVNLQLCYCVSISGSVTVRKYMQYYRARREDVSRISILAAELMFRTSSKRDNTRVRHPVLRKHLPRKRCLARQRESPAG